MAEEPAVLTQEQEAIIHELLMAHTKTFDMTFSDFSQFRVSILLSCSFILLFFLFLFIIRDRFMYLKKKYRRSYNWHKLFFNEYHFKVEKSGTLVKLLLYLIIGPLEL